MSAAASLQVEGMLATGAISSSDVARLRRVLHEDGIVSPVEADTLLRLNKHCAAKAAEWDEFFVEALTDYIVFQEVPLGYVNASNADWLIGRVSSNGLVNSKAEFDMIVNVIDKARWAPVSLATFALQQVKHAVVSGRGALRQGKSAGPGVVTAGEVDVLRRILYAFGGDGHVAVTRDEADILFDIDEAVAGAPANPAWTDFFVKAVANVVMASSGYRVPSREEALRQEAALIHPEQQTSVLAFLLSMVRANLNSVRDAYCDQTAEERALARLEHQRIEIITNEQITEVEADWLASRIGRDGRLTPSETALVTYLKQESPKIHPALTEAVDRLARAA